MRELWSPVEAAGDYEASRSVLLAPDARRVPEAVVVNVLDGARRPACDDPRHDALAGGYELLVGSGDAEGAGGGTGATKVHASDAQPRLAVPWRDESATIPETLSRPGPRSRCVVATDRVPISPGTNPSPAR